jgi:hypothetical protein
MPSEDVGVFPGRFTATNVISALPFVRAMWPDVLSASDEFELTGVDLYVITRIERLKTLTITVSEGCANHRACLITSWIETWKPLLQSYSPVIRLNTLPNSSLSSETAGK